MFGRWNFFFAAAAFALCISTGARAWPESDLWSDPADPGWGLSVHREGEITFAVLFLRGPDGRPIWYVASDVRQRNGDHLDPIGTPVLTGRLYLAGGSTVDVGTIELAHLFTDNLAVSYTIDGQRNSKQLRRLTWSDSSGALVGGWVGAFVPTPLSCDARPAAMQSIRVQRNGARMSVSFTGPGQAPICAANVAYSQAGSLGRLAGTYECRASAGGLVADQGAFEITEILVAESTGWTARLQLASGECTARGVLGLAREAVEPTAEGIPPFCSLTPDCSPENQSSPGPKSAASALKGALGLAKRGECRASGRGCHFYAATQQWLCCVRSPSGE